MRNTKQRKCIFNIINNSYNHLNAYEVYDIAKKVIPNISLGTVYRNLMLLSEKDMIRTLIVDGVIRYDRKDIHDHFICDKCKCIIDIPRKDNDIKYIDGNLVMDYDIKYRGICKKCQKKKGMVNNGIKGKQDRS